MKIPENFDRWMFDYKEGNLSPREAEAFENFLIQHPEYEVDVDAWDQAYVTSAPVVYPDAKKLEKKRRVGGWYAWSAAAALVLLMATSTLYVLTDNTPGELAGVTNAKNSFSADQSNLLNGSSFVNKPEDGTHLTVASDLAFNRLTNVAGENVGQTGSQTWTNSSRVDLTGSNGLMAQNSNITNGGNNPDGANVTGLTNSENNVGTGSNSELADTELAKLNGNAHNAKYLGNPESKNLGFDVSKKTLARYKPVSAKIKKLYHHIERSLRYPVGLTNLRDPELSLPQSSLLAFNPGFTGGMLRPRFEMNYRSQWLGTDMASQELNISYDNYVASMHGGVGILINAQDYGMGKFGDYNVSLLYSPKFVVSKNVMIEPSVKLTMGSLAANGDQLDANSSFEMDRGRVISTIDANEMNGTSQLWYKDYGLGVMVNTRWFYAGFSADNLAHHYENVYGNDLSSPSQSPLKMTAIIGTDKVNHSKPYAVSPFVAYQQFGSTPEIWAGANCKLKWLVVSGSANTNKEFTASVGMKFDQFKLVYRYDMTESVVMDDYFGSHNIGIRFNAEKKNRLTN